MAQKSKTPAILGGCGCLSLVISVALFAAAWFAAAPGASAKAKPPSEMVHYKSNRAGLTGNLDENYVAFTIDYPKTWIRKEDPQNYLTIERRSESQTWENLSVGYFKTAGSPQGNEAVYGELISALQNQFASQFSNLEKVREGKTKVGSYDAYEGVFRASVVADGNPVQVYIRVIPLPAPDGTKGVTLLMMGTSFHPELKQAEDLGTKGELPAVLDSFRFDE